MKKLKTLPNPNAIHTLLLDGPDVTNAAMIVICDAASQLQLTTLHLCSPVLDAAPLAQFALL